jgi:S-(hydroxymethyl)glutathione dehydrogenase/alcohol dehydrogenase
VRNAARVRVGESVLVIGCGGVGLQVVNGARLAGASPIVAVDLDPSKLERARARGATMTIDASQQDPVRAVRAALGGVDHAFEVIGRPETIRQAWKAVRPGGSVIVVGVAPRGVDFCLPALDLLSDKTVRGSYYGSGDPAGDLALLARLALDGRLGLDDVVSHVTDLDGVGAALERLRRGEGARTIALLDPQLAGELPLTA